MSRVEGKKTFAPRVMVDWNQQRHEQTAARVWHVLHRKQRRRKAAKALVFLSLPAAALLVFCLRFPALRDKAPLPTVVTSFPPPPDVERLKIHEGAMATLLTATTKVRLERRDTHDAVAVLEQGSADFDVMQAVPGASFTVKTHNVRIDVQSSRFTIESRAETDYVTCQRGSLRVRWSGGERVLPAGATEAFRANNNGAFPAEERPHHQPTERMASAYAKTSPTVPVAPAPAVAPLPEPPLPAPDVDDLIESANLARRHGDPRRAIALLDEAMAADGSPGWAAAAALTKGRVLLNEIGDAEAACDAFAWIRLHVPQSPLAEDALALEALTLIKRGLTRQAEDLVKLYLQRYPTGAQASRLRASASAL